MSEADIEIVTTLAPEVGEAGEVGVTTELYDGPSTMSALEIDAEIFKDKMKYISLQIGLLEPEEKTKFSSDFKVISKSMLKLRKAMRAKESTEAEYEIPWLFLGCVTVMLLIFG